MQTTPPVSARQKRHAAVDLWYVRPELADRPELLDAYRALLSPEETARERRFHFQKDRLLFLVTRALVRTALTSYVPEVGPREWVFSANEHGKPFVDLPTGFSRRFNLTNTRGLVACAVTGGGEIGLDAEFMGKERNDLALARRFFSPEEAEYLESVPPDKRREVFYRLWTLKEAYIKARGMGLSIPLDSFAFSIGSDGPPAIRFAPGNADNPNHWQFAQFWLRPDHCISLALRADTTAPLQVRVIETIPLRHETPAIVLPDCMDNTWDL
jgi:4'-phosphopantetheinyl transferase